jgi:hypothetical protein
MMAIRVRQTFVAFPEDVIIQSSPIANHASRQQIVQLFRAGHLFAFLIIHAVILSTTRIPLGASTLSIVTVRNFVVEELAVPELPLIVSIQIRAHLTIAIPESISV